VSILLGKAMQLQFGRKKKWGRIFVVAVNALLTDWSGFRKVEVAHDLI